MTFLPENYKEPETSNWMKFEEGENRFRILGATITGVEYWVTKKIEGKEVRRPVRKHFEEKVPVGELEVNPKTNEVDMPKVFWAFPVWNYKAEKVQILELKQKTIRQAITALINNKKWGDPTNYDIVVTRIEAEKVSYQVTPDPKEELPLDIKEIYKGTYINLDAMYEGKDPFTPEAKEDVDPSEVNI